MNMKKTIALLVGIFFVIGIVSLGIAQEKAKTEAPKVEKKAEKVEKKAAKTLKASGKVKSVKADANELVLEVAQKDKTTKDVAFSVDPKAKVTLSKKSITLKEVKEGEAVTVSYIEEAGKNVAKSIALKEKVAKKAEKAEKKTEKK